MQSLVDAAETKRGRWGCLLCNAAIDQAPIDKATEDIVRASMDRIKDGIKMALMDTNALDKTDLIWTTYFGGRVIIKSGASKKNLQAIKDQVLSLL